MKYFRNALTGFLLLILFSGQANAGAGTGEVSYPEIEGWKLMVSPDVYTPDNLWDLINGAAEAYLSYDFIDLHLADYTSKSGVEIHAEIYRHSSLPNAFGIYSSERSPEYNFIETGVQGYIDEGILNYFTGPYYVKLYSTGSGEEVQESLLKVSGEISAHLDEENAWPELLSLFPPQGKLPNKEHYVRENFIGFNFLRTAYTAEYEGGYRLFILQGKDREEMMEMVRAYLAFTKQDIDPEKESSFTIRDRYNGDIPVILMGASMAGIIDGSELDQAAENLKKLEKNISSRW
jgi:hypothetical protein